MIRLTRRQLIQTGFAGTLVLAAAGCTRSGHAATFEDAGYAYRELSVADRAMVAAVAAAMLAGALPATDRAAAIVAAVRGVDVAVAGLSPDVTAEVQQLFSLLGFAPSRAVTTGIWSSWTDASVDDVSGFLTRWRFSPISLFRTGYQALHQLVMASWYGNSISWQRIGYPGPPVVG